jgi:HlyD family secretion protein
MSYAMDRPIALPWWRRKPWAQLIVSGLVAILCITTLVLIAGTTEQTVRIPIADVTIATVAGGGFQDFVPLQAQVQAQNTVYIDAQAGGTVEHILAHPGDYVQQGQPLVDLKNAALELDVLEREARLIESITELQSYETQLEQNRVANEKARALIEYNIVRLRQSLARTRVLVAQSLEPVATEDSQKDELDYDQQILPMQRASNVRQEALRLRQLPEIQNQLLNLRQDLKITHGTLDDLRIRAPISGRIIAMDLKIGENRNRGQQLAEISPDKADMLHGEVDQYYLGRVHVGQMADVELDNRHFNADVTRVYPQVKNGTFAIDLSFKGVQPQNLIPGEAVQGRLSLGTASHALTLPAGAFLERTGGQWAFVLDPDGRTARRRSISLGRRTAYQVEVLGGLSAGDRVIISDYAGLDKTNRIKLEK